MKLVARKPSRTRAEVLGRTLQTIGTTVGALPIGVRPQPWTVRLKLRKPSRTRAQLVGEAMGSVGSAVGALPATVRPGERPTAVKVGVPLALAGTVAAVVVRKRSSSDVSDSRSPSSSHGQS